MSERFYYYVTPKNGNGIPFSVGERLAEILGEQMELLPITSNKLIDLSEINREFPEFNFKVIDRVENIGKYLTELAKEFPETSLEELREAGYLTNIQL